MRLRLQRAEFEDVPDLKVTACFGLTAYAEPDGSSHLFIQADEALYEAKRVRDAVRSYHPGTTVFSRGVSPS